MSSPKNTQDKVKRKRRTKAQMAEARGIPLVVKRKGRLTMEEMWERECEIAELILKKRELEMSELEALMQIAPNGMKPNDVSRGTSHKQMIFISDLPAGISKEEGRSGGYLSDYLVGELRNPKGRRVRPLTHFINIDGDE